MAKGVDKQALAERILEIQKFFKINSRRFASEIGMDASQLSKIEKGILGISTDYAVAINERFGVNANWILTGRGDKGVWKYVPHGNGNADDPIEVKADLNAYIKELTKDIVQTKATVNVLKITVAKLAANQASSDIEEELLRLDHLIDAEADSLFSELKKKFG